MPTGKLFQITVTGSLNGQFCQNILHYQFEITTTHTPYLDAAALGNAWTTDELDNWLSILPQSYETSSVRCAQVSDGGSATYTQTSGVSGMVGARDAEISVTSIGPLLCFPAMLSRNVVGKIFLPGIAEADIAYGFIDAGLQTAITTFLGNWVPAITISGSTVGNAYYCVANAARDNWARPDGGYLSPTIGTQRRRARPVF
jgi:hypothetical protein